MTNLQQAAQQALEALEGELWLMLDKPEDEQYRVKYAYLLTVITALRTALEQQAKPVAWGVFDNNLHDMFFTEEEAQDMVRLKGDGSIVAPLYTTPALEQPPLPVQPEPVTWDRPSASFNEWWNGDYDGSANPFEKDSAAYWAWSGWKAAQPQRKPLTDKQILANETMRYYFGQNGGAGPVSKQGRKVVDAIEALHDIKENT